MVNSRSIRSGCGGHCSLSGHDVHAATFAIGALRGRDDFRLAHVDAVARYATRLQRASHGGGTVLRQLGVGICIARGIHKARQRDLHIRVCLEVFDGGLQRGRGFRVQFALARREENLVRHSSRRRP